MTTAKIINHHIKNFSPDVWLLKNDPIKNYPSKDSFPSELVRRLILNFTDLDYLVFDPFVGSGKSMVEAQKANRNYLGFDIKQKYLDITRNYLDRR